MITKLEHMALSVSNLKRSVEFYTQTLGLELVRELDCGPETPLGTVVGLPGCRARIAHLMCGETMLELFEYIEPRGDVISSQRRQADGFQSSDVRGDYQNLLQQGVQFISEPIEFRPGVWIVYFRGPDGEIAELRQTPGGKTGS